MVVFSIELGLLFLIAALLSSFGFYKFLYFISIGYGFAIAGEGIYLLLGFKHTSIITILMCIVFILYGLRLGFYLLIREHNSSAYRKILKGASTDDSKINLRMRIGVWIPCCILYGTQVSPVFFALSNETSIGTASYIGLIVMICGILLEWLADYHKSKAKETAPNIFCSTGIYKIVRFPNYLGEVLLWTGVIITGFDALVSVGQWLVALIGYLGIIYVMLSGSRRLEIRQDITYGDLESYQAYKQHTPMLIPLIPWYSIKNWTWLKW